MISNIATGCNRISKFFVVLFMGLIASQGASAAVTTITFDEFTDGTTVTNQYQAMGVSITGATVLHQSLAPWPAQSAPNFAYAPLGLMVLNIDSSITGEIHTVSAYLSGETDVGIYAYDANNVLVGQGSTPQGTDNVLITVSSVNPIVRVEIHNGGASFSADTIRLDTALPEPEVPACIDIAKAYYDAIQALSAQDYARPAHFKAPRLVLSLQIVLFKRLAENDRIPKKVLVQSIVQMEKMVKSFVKATPARANLLSLLNQLKVAANDNLCRN